MAVTGGEMHSTKSDNEEECQWSKEFSRTRPMKRSPTAIEGISVVPVNRSNSKISTKWNFFERLVWTTHLQKEQGF
jgi:hypothetical protein